MIPRTSFLQVLKRETNNNRLQFIEFQLFYNKSVLSNFIWVLIIRNDLNMTFHHKGGKSFSLKFVFDHHLRAVSSTMDFARINWRSLLRIINFKLCKYKVANENEKISISF